MTHLAIDSFSPHTDASVAALRRAQCRLALRYHYNLSHAEIDRLHHGGIAVGLIAEFDTLTWHPVRDSPETGADHAVRAVTYARTLGFPSGCVIWLTADSAIPDPVRSAEYFRLAMPILHRNGYKVGAYGPSGFIDYLYRNQLTDYTWECGAMTWNNWKHSTTAVLRQLPIQQHFGDVQVDINECTDLVGAYLPNRTACAYQGGDDFDMASIEDLREIIKTEINRALEANQFHELRGSVATVQEIRDLLAPLYENAGVTMPVVDYNVNLPNEPLVPKAE